MKISSTSYGAHTTAPPVKLVVFFIFGILFSTNSFGVLILMFAENMAVSYEVCITKFVK